jgi:hypothetical protein
MKTFARQIFIRNFIFFLILSISRCCFAGSASEPTLFGEWSAVAKDPTNQISLRARLVVAEGADVFGPLCAVSYLELQHPPGEESPAYIHFGPGVAWSECELLDSNGKTIPPLPPIWDDVPPEMCWLALPSDSITRFRLPNLRVPRVHSPGELIILCGSSCWHISQSDTNNYYLSCVLDPIVPRGGTPLPAETDSVANLQREIWHGTLRLPPVKISAKSLSGK